MEYLEHLIKGIESIDAWCKDFSRHAENVGLSNEGFSLGLITKTVFEEDGKIIRVSSLPTTLERVAVYEFFKSQDCDIFLPERIICQTDWCGVTEQKKIPTILHKPESQAFRDVYSCYPEKMVKIKELLEKYRFKWFNSGNYGIDENGKVKIFDYIVNLTWSLHKNALVDGKGEVVFKFDA